MPGRGGDVASGAAELDLEVSVLPGRGEARDLDFAVGSFDGGAGDASVDGGVGFGGCYGRPVVGAFVVAKRGTNGNGGTDVIWGRE